MINLNKYGDETRLETSKLDWEFQFERHLKRIFGFYVKTYSPHWPGNWPEILKMLNGSDHLVFDIKSFKIHVKLCLI